MKRKLRRAQKSRVAPELEKEWSDLVDVAELLGIQIRRERGMFKSGSCVVNDAKMIILNRRLSMEGQIEVLLSELAACDLESVYMRPEIREKLEQRGRQT